jgi:retron-type reverse transcriptase
MSKTIIGQSLPNIPWEDKPAGCKNVLWRYIAKENGKWRPLGIPATQDKLLQTAVKRILKAIFEQDFYNCSYGYRPGVGVLDAVGKLTVKLQFGKYQYVA